jgi:hypothetical protein
MKFRKVASLPSMKTKREKISDPDKVRMINRKHFSHAVLRNRIPQSLEATLEKDHSVRLSRGYEFINGVAAISRDKYAPTMGEIVKQDESFVFFKTSEESNYTPVALSRSTNTLYPIASIIHIKDVTPALKAEILAKGFVQYYYHPGLKFLSVEAHNGDIMKTYNDLVRQGHQAELEVLKPGQRPH